MSTIRPLAIFLATAVLVTAPLMAYPGDRWGGGWGGRPGYSGRDFASRTSTSDSREGRVNAESFAADGAAATLGHGPIALTTAPGTSLDSRQSATFEAAVIDQLSHAGYDTIKVDPQGGQIVEVQMVRDVLVPEEAKRSPLSGEMEVGVSNRGSSLGLALAYDATKPRKALLETRLEARIKDRVSGKLLWEGHAQIATREDDSHWNENAIAGRLAGALFDHFPAAARLGE